MMTIRFPVLQYRFKLQRLL